MPTSLDAVDQDILDRRRTRLDAQHGPRVGDFVEFTDGATRRISYLWTVPDGQKAQTSTDGRFYLGDDGVDFSGSLYPAVPTASLTDTARTRLGAVWLFHHDRWRAYNAITTVIPFRVYACHLPAPH
ncbi:hypothetical protein [Actinocatenispora comari]|uniref:Uncharacterized protein n=1 Tax=Actinocatenispora comari TaxID=2807577 RepID=A0A8J4EM28_9ACTN|nr:hypothetical protein [Actinocatenispora comari]GIL29121.1 hypothetical protein NUM_43750 [Actinocatenispora comari]